MSSGSEAPPAVASPLGPAAVRARAEAVAERMRRDPVRWRRHQWEAVHAVRAVLDAGAREGRARCWAVLPPGAGKTYLGVAIARAALEEGSAAKVVVLVPTTAVQGQWVRSAEELGMSAATDRSMAADLTVLTFQAVAVMLKPTGDDPADPDVDPEGDPADMPEEVDGIADAEVVARLHVNGSDLVARMSEMSDLFVVLDESHHLLEAWGELLVAMLDHLPTTGVLGLTGTPRESLVGAQRRAVDRLFGTVGHTVSVADVVAEGDLAPYADLVHVTTPTAAERDWLAEDRVRYAELTALLLDPTLGSQGLVSWLAQRFVEPTRSERGVSWTLLHDTTPELADAVLRLVHAGVLEAPLGAHLEDAHRVAPDAEDWLLVADDWLRRRVAPSEDPRDVALIELVRRTLPAVGWVWTRRGIRRGRAMADRVLARSEAKSLACVEIATGALHDLGPRARLLVLTDHESASSTVPMTLRGVVDRKAGSAWAVLGELVADPTTALADPLLVSPRTVAAAPRTLHDLVAFVATRDAALARTLRVVDVPAEDPEAARVPLARLVGVRDAHGALAWQAPRWIREVTDYFAAGRCQVLVGTRGLLGEGWDARSVTGVVDLTTATAPQPVVQVRGRALRTDPAWPEKVAVNWTVVCVDPAHPAGAEDWKRLVTKMQGYPMIGDAGRLVDGVTALDRRLRPAVPPSGSLVAEVNRTSRQRARDLERVRAAWRARRPGSDDVVVVASRLRGQGTGALRTFVTPRHVEVDHVVARARERRAPTPPKRGAELETWWERLGAGALAGGVAGALVSSEASVAMTVVAGLVPPVVLLTEPLWRRIGRRGRWESPAARRRSYARALLDHARRPPALPHVAGAVAGALEEVGLLGSSTAEIEFFPDGSYSARVIGATDAEAAIFDAAVHEAFGPLEDATHLVRVRLRTLPEGRMEDRRALRRARRGRVELDGVRHYAVPRALSGDGGAAAVYARQWARWTGGDARVVVADSPEGAGVLAAHGVVPLPRGRPGAGTGGGG